MFTVAFAFGLRLGGAERVGCIRCSVCGVWWKGVCLGERRQRLDRDERNMNAVDDVI